MGLRIKKSDRVRVIAGKDRGREGRVLKVYPDTDKALVEGINMVRKHERPSQGRQSGGIISKEAPIHLCKLLLVDPKTGDAGRFRVEEQKGKRVRVHLKSGNQL